ncbi:tetratricopeptide repeat protein [bacterium]|nr:tetratricopeptide repeat protein [bacterium]
MRERFYILILLLVVFLMLSPSIRYDFTNWDDRGLVLRNSAIRSLSPSSIARMFTPKAGGTYQPVRLFSYAIDYKIAGYSQWIYHLHNILLYLLNILLVYLILSRFFDRRYAFVGAFLFGLLPVHIESVVWVAARKEVLSGLFFFLAIYLYILFRERGSRWLFVLSVVSSFLAILSKPSTIILPGMLFLYDVGLSKRRFSRADFVIYIPYLLPAVLAGIYFVLFAGTQSSFHTGGFIHTFFLEFYIAARYILNLIFPYHLLPRYIVSAPVSFLDWRIIFGIMFAAVSIYLLLITYKRDRRFFFALGWFYVGLIPVFNIIPISTLMADRYVYISSFAYPFALCVVLSRWSGIRRFIYPVLGILFIWYAFSFVRMERVWRNSESLWSYVISVDPDHPLAHNNLGMVYVEEKRYELAVPHFKAAVKSMPKYKSALINLSGAYLELGRYPDAILFGEKAMHLFPDDPKVIFNLGNAYAQAGEAERAILLYKRLLEMNPNDVDVLVNLGIVYTYTGDWEKAAAHFQKMLDSGIRNEVVYLNLASAYYKVGKPDKAIEYFSEFLRLYPNSPDAPQVMENIKLLKSMTNEGKR